jgi:D-serine deaminase-like pyridoxal phosphate-dependent protein
LTKDTGPDQSTLSPQQAILREIETPALVVDYSALTRNIEKMAEEARKRDLALRPHAKTHKSVEIARLQIDAGATGIACATVAEAEMLASAGIGGLLLTAPQVGESKAFRIARINREHGITVVVDHASQIEMLAAALQPDERKLAIAVDVDIGHMRTGITDIAEGLRLAQMIAKDARLEFAGVQGFAGHAQHVPVPLERKQAAAKAAKVLQGFVETLTANGLPPRLVSGSGTGTFLQDSAGPYNELQVGSYVFMDSDYAQVLDEAGLGPAFETSLFVLATVVSVNRTGQVTVDAGTKALATNGPLPTRMIGVPNGARYRFAGDEHGVISIPEGQRTPKLGERVLIVTTHCDPTVNLHAAYHVVDRDRIHRWRIGARYGDAQCDA